MAIVAAKWSECYYDVEIKNVWHRRKILKMELTIGTEEQRILML